MPDDHEFLVIPDEARVEPPKNAQAWMGAERLQQTLGDLFPHPCEYGKCSPGQYTGSTIIDRLVGTNETRIGPEPEGYAREQLEKQAAFALETATPIALVGIYGTPRHLDTPALNTAQLADFSAIMMAQAALDRIESAFEPGAHFRLIDENLTALWLDLAQHPEGREGVERFQGEYARYLASRRKLIDTMTQEGLINTGNSRIELLSETQLYQSVSDQLHGVGGRTEYDFLARCEATRPIALEYLIRSGQELKRAYGADDRQWPSSSENQILWQNCLNTIQNTPEYARLQEAGWQGAIPPEMRSYYLNKFRQILGREDLEADDPLLLFHVATYLASTLEKYKAGTLTTGLPKGTPVIKVPLSKPVDGRPLSHQTLVAQRTLPNPTGPTRKRVSSTNRSAWGSLAVQSAGKLRLMDVADYLSLPPELVVPAQVYMVGPDNGVGSYLANTAIILEK